MFLYLLENRALVQPPLSSKVNYIQVCQAYLNYFPLVRSYEGEIAIQYKTTNDSGKGERRWREHDLRSRVYIHQNLSPSSSAGCPRSWDFRARPGLWRTLVEIPYHDQVYVDAPSFGLATIHKSEESAAIDREALELLPDKLKATATGARRFSEAMVCATKVSGNSAISAKSMRTVFPCWSTPKLLGCMSDWVNMRRSPRISTGDSCFWAWVESSVYAWPRLHVIISERWMLEKMKARMYLAHVPL